MTTKSNFRLSLASLDMIQVINYLIIREKCLRNSNIKSYIKEYFYMLNFSYIYYRK